MRLCMVMQAAKNAVDVPVDRSFEYAVDRATVAESIKIMNIILDEKRQLHMNGREEDVTAEPQVGNIPASRS